MELDKQKTCTQEEAEMFFSEHSFEVIANCMRLQPHTDGLPEEKRQEVRLLAMNMTAEKHNFGPYQNLCDTCKLEFGDCNSTEEHIMFGLRESKDNVCFCTNYQKESSNGNEDLHEETTNN